MNDLEKYFTGNTERLIFKWQHYFEIYDRHFSRFRGTDTFGAYSAVPAESAQKEQNSSGSWYQRTGS